MELSEKLHRCNTGEHDLIEILRSGDDLEYVARWCRICGSVVVDVDIDGRMMEPGGHMRMISPQVTKASQIYFSSHED